VPESLPGETLALAATAQPLEPDPPGHIDQAGQAAEVAVHPEVVEVSDQASRERRLLRLDREVPVAPAPLADGLHRPPQARTPGLTPQGPLTAAGPTPVEREAEEVKGIRTFPAALARRWARKRDEAGLVRVQGQSIALKPLGENRLNPLGVVVAFKADEEIIGLADEGRRATQARLDLPFEPHVEHVVQVDVAQQWGEHRPLRRATVRLGVLLAVQHPHV